MHAFVPKHCQNLLYKPNKPDRAKQISVAMFSLPHICIDLKIDNLDRVSIPTKIVATFDFPHPILGTTYGV